MATTTGIPASTTTPADDDKARPRPLDVYLDAGPLARLLSRLAPRRVPGEVLAALGAAPLGLALLLRGTELGDTALDVLLGWFVLLGSLAGARMQGRLGWLVPPIVRAGEYATLTYLAIAADALPAAFVLLSVLCFHHYDAVYRLRHQKLAPPAWLALVGGGWELRVLIGFALYLGGVIQAGYLVAAGLLGMVYLTESVLGWVRFSGSARETAPVQSEDEEEDE
jgi:hypothetical protein